MFKLAINAGHYLKTAGKRCLKKLDPNETREWVLNDRICDKIEQKLKAYEGYQLLRIDDTTGATDVSLANRVTKANKWGADFYLSIHHNAGIKGGTGGGVVAYVYTNVDAKTLVWQKKLYDAIIKYTGLRGNRSAPLANANLYECRKTAMPCVLLECGFMDSASDIQYILTDEYADRVATACVEVIVAQGKLTKKVIKEEPVSDKTYRVQVGAYSKKANAEAMVKKLKDDGYDAIIV